MQVERMKGCVRISDLTTYIHDASNANKNVSALHAIANKFIRNNGGSYITPPKLPTNVVPPPLVFKFRDSSSSGESSGGNPDENEEGQNQYSGEYVNQSHEVDGDVDAQ